MPKRLRLDQLLVGRGFFPSREQARRAILAGNVSVGTRIAAKPSELLDEQTAIAVKPARKYVGRGALKLESALERFGIDVHGKTGLDIGASTGGFTDCMLQRGAQSQSSRPRGRTWSALTLCIPCSRYWRAAR